MTSGRPPRAPSQEGAAPEPSVFVLLRDSPLRRAALAADPGSAERYWLYGADQLAARGFAVRHSLELGVKPRHRVGDRTLRALVRAAGGYEGDFATVLASRSAANAAGVVLSTVDTVGIPAALLRQARVLRRPLVYVSIGLLGRIAQLRNRPVRRLYERALRGTAAIVAYGHAEAEALRAWLPGHDVRFVPFGVDTSYFAPQDVEPEVDVLAVGADPQRDYELLMRVAASLPGVSFSVICSADQARAVRAPANVRVEPDVPFEEIRGRLARARAVALPVRDNLYSGATTTLLQSMATAKPVVVSRTAAIAEGYGLADGENVRLVEPGDDAAFAGALREVLADPGDLGRRARETVQHSLTWDRYVDVLADVLRAAAAR